jgi:hypothetical protein
LERIKATLGVGNIYFKSSDNTYRWKVSNINDLFNVIIPHFIKYRAPLCLCLKSLYGPTG